MSNSEINHSASIHENKKNVLEMKNEQKKYIAIFSISIVLIIINILLGNKEEYINNNETLNSFITIFLEISYYGSIIGIIYSTLGIYLITDEKDDLVDKIEHNHAILKGKQSSDFKIKQEKTSIQILATYLKITSIVLFFNYIDFNLGVFEDVQEKYKVILRIPIMIYFIIFNFATVSNNISKKYDNFVTFIVLLMVSVSIPLLIYFYFYKLISIGVLLSMFITGIIIKYMSDKNINSKETVN